MTYATFTFDTLSAALQRHMEDDFADFTVEVPTLIGLGELRLLRDLDLTIFDLTDTSSTTQVGIDQLSKPTGTIAIQWLRVNGSAMEPRPLDWLLDYTVDADLSLPRFYAEQDETTIRLAPSPDQTYPISFRINKRPIGLGSGAETTWLSTNTGDALFAACMMEAELFARALDEYGVYQQRYMELLGQAKAEHRDLVRKTYRVGWSQPAVLTSQRAGG